MKNTFRIASAVVFIALSLVLVFVLSSCGGKGVTYKRIDAVEPTCTQDGNTAYYVGSDGLFYKRGLTGYKQIEANSWIIEKTGHLEVVDNAVAPTCTHTGLSEGKHCAYCGQVFVAQEVIPVTQHVYKVKVDMTTSPVTAIYTCTTCSESFRGEYIPGTVRDGSTVTVKVTAPTTTSEGYTTYTFVADYAVKVDGTETPVIVAHEGDTYVADRKAALPAETTTVTDPVETTTPVEETTTVTETVETTVTDVIETTTATELVETTTEPVETTATETTVTEVTTTETTTVVEETTVTEEVVETTVVEETTALETSEA